jgi:Domain of unknown function (DUF4349)
MQSKNSQRRCCFVWYENGGERMKTRFVISLFLLLLLTMAACGAPPPRAVIQTVVVERAMEAPAATEAPAVPASGFSATAAPPAGAKQQSAELAIPNPASGRMIIKDALMELLVANPDLAIERVTSLAADQGGYLISSRVWVENGFKNAELKMGVPSNSFEDTLNQLRRLGVQVLNEQSSGTDVSADYADLQSRLTNLEATSARVRAFLDQAKTVEESLKINAQLSDLEGQIEQVKGQMKFYEGRSAYSTVTVLLHPAMPTPTVTPTPTPTPGWNPGKTVGSASKVMVQMLQGLIDLAIWMAFLLWPFALVLLVIWWLIRRWRRRNRKARPEPEPESVKNKT